METPQLKYLLQEYPDFLTRYTPEERALIEHAKRNVGSKMSRMIGGEGADAREKEHRCRDV
jgi:hypothetical protein